MKNAMAAVLAQYKVGATSDWKSPTGRRAGRWTMTRTYQRDGMKCAQITHKFTVGSGYSLQRADMPGPGRELEAGLLIAGRRMRGAHATRLPGATHPAYR